MVKGFFEINEKLKVIFNMSLKIITKLTFCDLSLLIFAISLKITKLQLQNYIVM